MVGKYPAVAALRSSCAATKRSLRRLVIGTQRICALQTGLKIGDRKSLVRSFVGQREFLAGRESNHSGQRNFLLGEIVGGRDQLLLARLVFDLRPQRVDRRSNARLLLRHRFLVERLRGLDLRLRGFHAGCPGNRLQIGVAGREHDQIARVLQIEMGHAFADHGRAVFLNRLPVEDSLRRRGAHIKIGEGPDRRAAHAPKRPETCRNPSASRLSFSATFLHIRVTFGSRSLSFCHFSPRASMVLYSDKRPARF